jgi:hypothetical protein
LNGSRRDATRVDASSEERSFERPFAVHAASAETARFSHREQVRNGTAGFVEDLCLEVDLNSTETLAG